MVIYKDNKVETSLDNGFISVNMATSLLTAVVARGSSITIYINHQQVTTIQDSTFASGHIGVFAYKMNNPTEVVFRDAKVWSLDSQNSLFAF